MRKLIDDVAGFHKRFGIDALHNSRPMAIKDKNMQRVRINFLFEELKEYAKSCGFELSSNVIDPNMLRKVTFEESFESNIDVEQSIDGLIDLIWVAVGTGLLHGFGEKLDGIPIFEEAWNRVYTANMAKVKVGSAAESKRNDPNDIVKPKGWRHPEFGDLICRKE